MKILSKTALSISTLITISACNTSIAPNSTQNQEQKSFITKGLGDATIGSAAKSASSVGNNPIGTWNGKTIYKDSIGLYYIVISGKTYVCKFNPSWLDSWFGVQKCK